MANQFADKKEVLKEMLKRVVAQLPVLKVVDKTYNQRVSQQRQGGQVYVRRPPRFVSTDAYDAIAQDLVVGEQRIRLDRVAQGGYTVAPWEMIRSVDEVATNASVMAIVDQIATKIQHDLMSEVSMFSKQVPSHSKGRALRTWADLVASGTRLGEESIDSMRALTVLSPTDYGNLVIETPQLSGVSRAGDKAYMKGDVTEINGFNITRSNVLGQYVSGSRNVTGTTVSAANTNVNVHDVIDQNYMAQMLPISTQPNATVSRGDGFTIAGVLAYDYASQTEKDYLQTFRVVDDVTADAAGAAEIRITPSIIVQQSGVFNNTQAMANTAYATVVAAPANGAAITWLEEPNLRINTRACFMGSGVTFVGTHIRGLMSNVHPSTVVDSTSGLSMQDTSETNFRTGETSKKLTIHYGVQNLDPSMGILIGGSTG